MMSPTSIVLGLSAHFSHYSFVKLRPPTSGACTFIILCLCDELLPSLVSSGRLYLFASLFSTLSVASSTRKTYQLTRSFYSLDKLTPTLWLWLYGHFCQWRVDFGNSSSPNQGHLNGLEWYLMPVNISMAPVYCRTMDIHNNLRLQHN